jgi:hypothetical protein
MQGGGKRNPAKNRQIAAAWMVLSLVAEQGGYPAVAGKRKTPVPTANQIRTY